VTAKEFRTMSDAVTSAALLCFLLAAAALASEDQVAEGPGLAARYPGDAGMEKDAAVVFTESFESPDVAGLKDHWSTVDNKEEALSISEDVPQASSGKHSIRVTAKRGKNAGGYLYKVLPPGYDELYARIYVKFAPDYGFDHHFCSLGGEMDPKPWPVGRAGLRPKDYFGTGIEPTTELAHTYPAKQFPPPGFWHFYTYWPEMRSWETVEGAVKNNPPDGTGTSFYGNNFSPAEPTFTPRGEWVCLEWMVRLNSSPDKTDGAQRFWVNGKLIGNWGPGSVQGFWVRDTFRIVPGDERAKPFEGFRWRTNMQLKINKFKLENYVSDTAFETGDRYRTDHPDFLMNDKEYTCWFDDVVVATQYIGPIASPK
jgi:hypothetical protein